IAALRGSDPVAPRLRTRSGNPPTVPTPGDPAAAAPTALAAAPTAVVSTVTVPVPPAGHTGDPAFHCGNVSVPGSAGVVPATGVPGPDRPAGTTGPTGGGAAPANWGATRNDASSVSTVTGTARRTNRPGEMDVDADERTPTMAASTRWKVIATY